MLAHVLAIAVGLSSLVLFLTAFSMSDIHQRDDFLWSGVGLFYALVLWFCASRITGSLLLGQVAAVALVISFNWQTLKLRKAIANPDRGVDADAFSLTELISGFFKGSGESSPQPDISQVLEEEKDVDNSTPAIDNPVSVAVEQKTTETPPSDELSPSTTEETDVDDSTSAIDNLVGAVVGQETTETPPSDELSSSTAEETDILTTESNDLIESTTASTTEAEVNTTAKPETIVTEEIIVPTVEEEEELGETKEFEQTNSNELDLTEVEATDETSSEFHLESQVEEIKEEKPMDVEFTPSAGEEKTSSSIDDFLADLDKGIDKPAQDK